MAVLVLGLLIMVLGTFANLEAAVKNQERYDEKYLQQLQIDKMLEDFVQKQGAERKAFELKEAVTPKIENLKKEEVINDSQVQPRNPVPPDVSSDENPLKPDFPKHKQKEHEITIAKVENQLKDSGIIINEEKLTVNKEENILKPKSPAQDNIAMIKQQQLIETIKQYGKEQKELNKEQKGILDIIKPTKNELSIIRKKLVARKKRK